MYDGSAGFDLLDAIWLGRALEEADYLWYEEPMREFSIAAYKRLAERTQLLHRARNGRDSPLVIEAEGLLSGSVAGRGKGNRMG